MYNNNQFSNSPKINHDKEMIDARENIKKNKRQKKRIPGPFDNKYSLVKDKHNILILHSCKLLKAYYEEGITALILDGKEMNTTNSLRYLGERLKELIIVEYDKETYSIIKNSIKNDSNKKCYNCLMNDYITKYNNPKVNVVYFDLTLNFFSSQNSIGSDKLINEFLSKSEVNELIFAATFCLRNAENMKFDIEVDKILLLLDKIFISNGFDKTPLISKKDMRYQGQNGKNKALMFVLYYLKRHNEENSY